MAVLHEYYNSGDDDILAIYGDIWGSQSFTASYSYEITSVKLEMWRVLSPGTVTVSIKARDGNGKPTGADLAVGTIDGDTFQTSAGAAIFEEITFTSGYVLTSGTQYTIVARALNGDSSNKVNWTLDKSSPTYTGGTGKWLTTDGGSSWYEGTDRDYMFENWGNPSFPIDKTYTKTEVAIANDEFWYDVSGTMTELAAATGDFDTGSSLDACDAFQKIFIANKTDLKIVDFINTKLTVTALTTAPTRGATVTQASSNATMVVDFVNTAKTEIYGYTTSGTFVTTAGYTLSGGGMDPETRVPSAVAEASATPHWYDWTVYPKGTMGTMPTSASIIALAFGRIYLAGFPEDPHQWGATRVFNPFDLNYDASTDDVLRAVAGGYTQAAKCPDIVVGIIPYKDDYVVFGCASSCYVLIGNPTEGEMFAIKGTGGLLSKFSHSWDSMGNLYLLTNKGLLRIPPGFGPPENLTIDRWPEFITDLAHNASTDRLTLGYDQKRNGLLVSKTTFSTGANSCWWYDFSTEGLFPENYPTAMAITYQFYSDDAEELILGCADGYLKNHNKTAKDDDGTAIDSYLSLGPIPLGNSPVGEGTIGPIDVVLGGGGASGSETDSDDADYKVFTADTAAELIEKLVADGTPIFAGTITGPGRRRGSKRTQSARGVYGGVRLENDTASESWIFECLNVGQKPKGRAK